MDKRTFTGAAGVSPPWLGNVLAVMNAVCERERSPTTAGLRQPLLIASGVRSLQKCYFPPVDKRLRSQERRAYASRSWCTVFVRCQSAICDGQTHIHKTGGR
jgi:hypothetical protein